MKKNDILIYILAIIIIAAMYGSYKYFYKPTSQNNQNINQNSTTTAMDNTQLKIETLREGTGEGAKNSDKLTVNYLGTFENGQKFDSSYDRKTPFEFTLGQGMVIQGWEQGMLGMKVGEKRKLFVPYTLGYGENDYGPIPGKSNLIFEVELLKIN